MSLKTKLIILFLVSSFVPFATVGVLLYLDNPQILRELVYFAAFLSIFVIFLGSTLSRIVIDPLKHLIRATTAAKGKDLSVRVPVESKDEIGELAEVFNQMMNVLEQTDKTKTEFVSLASHQLRTPLTIVKWYSERLSTRNNNLYQNQKKYVTQINESTNRMIRLVNSLLSVTTVELGSLPLEKKKINIATAARRAVKEQSMKIADKGIVMRQKYQRNLPEVSLDPRLMHAVLQNLISNALTYTPSKGSVTLQITLEKKNILIAVKDTGYGIPKNQQSMIFTKLFRADNIKLRDTQGSGLGLYLTKAIVEKMGGRIWFESKENKGTTFYVSIPLG